MKEIIYIQAGNLSNYTGTHFWNTQETYLAEETADSPYDFDVSFREGRSPTGHPTICPRLLVFDTKANFGTLAKSNALLGANEDELPTEDLPAIWSGEIAEYRQDRIPKSAYHASLDEVDDEKDDKKLNDIERSREDIRFWSDYNRSYFIPRTVQQIPDPAEWENTEGDWNLGQALFTRHDEDHGLMDGSLRLFLEECDSPQGLQVINDTSTFGGFINLFLTSFRDQYLKVPCLVFPLLSDALSQQVAIDDSTGTRKVINDALYLRSLDELASISVPTQPPNAWPTESWSRYLTAEVNNVYHDSAILSAHIETSTLPLRLKGAHDDLAKMAAKLNWRGITRFCELSGIFPVNSAEDFERRIVNFSASRMEHDCAKCSQFTRLDVTRGFSSSGVSAYEKWSAGQSLQDTYISRTHAAPYPIPTSYPAFFKPTDDTPPSRRGIFAQPVHTSVFSSLSTSSHTAHRFSSYASVIETYLKGKPTDQALGFENDDLKDLVNDLWTLHDNFDEGRDEGETSSLGEDEG